MSRHISLRPRASLVALVTAFALVPASALGEQPEKMHRQFAGPVSDTLCGIQVLGTAVNNVNLFQYADGSFKATYSQKVTFTNPVNDKSVIVSKAGQESGSGLIIDEEAGTLTVVDSTAGLSEKIQTPNGPILLRAAGLITSTLTLDLETGDVISDEIIIKGPHPEDCEVLIAALSGS